ncbi:hypothetical protein EAG_02143 [Camponotus floridanus]|uniref:Uncharacterized protein n=1 Tax=Camponotus floridanus TaxID=104421 RepID=E2B1S3_CAMFO|nr:hypothetical protein EAG_02143 [Camponotus floridanus]
MFKCVQVRPSLGINNGNIRPPAPDLRGGTASFRVHVTAARGHNDNRAIIIMLITGPGEKERKGEDRENQIVNLRSLKETKGHTSPAGWSTRRAGLLEDERVRYTLAEGALVEVPRGMNGNKRPITIVEHAVVVVVMAFGPILRQQSSPRSGTFAKKMIARQETGRARRENEEGPVLEIKRLLVLLKITSVKPVSYPLRFGFMKSSAAMTDDSGPKTSNRCLVGEFPILFANSDRHFMKDQDKSGSSNCQAKEIT